MKKKPNLYRKTFISGIIVVIPILITIATLTWLFNIITGKLPNFFKILFPSSSDFINNNLTVFQVLGFFFFLIIIYICGIFTRNFIGRKIISYGEKLLLKVPILSPIYSTIRQVANAIFNDQEKTFNQVVMLEYPKEGCYTVGFVTCKAPEECCERTGEDLLSIFIPTTPNPTSGFLIFSARKKVHFLDVSIAEGMQLVISAGAVTPTRDTSTDTVSPIKGENNEAS